MSQKPTRYQKMLDDILQARHDLQGLAQAHGLSAAQLARWIDKPANQKTLAGLCLLADYQTQLLLSRYRSLAATRLIKLAGDENDGSAETARKACGDLLRLDLKRTESIAENPPDDPSLLNASLPIRHRRDFYASTDHASATTTGEDHGQQDDQ